MTEHTSLPSSGLMLPCPFIVSNFVPFYEVACKGRIVLGLFPKLSIVFIFPQWHECVTRPLADVKYPQLFAHDSTFNSHVLVFHIKIAYF